MPIRLSKVIKDLNIGLDTAVNFLNSQGQKVESNPNFKISEEQYKMLVDEFDTDKKLKKEAEKQSQDRQIKKEKEKEAEAAKKVEVEEIPTVIDESLRPKIKTIDKIDLDNLNKPKKQTPVAEEKKQQAEKVQKAEKTEKKSVNQSGSTVKDTDGDEVFRTNVPKLTNVPKVLGTMDLSKLNSATRPDKKSKEEKEKERQERYGKGGGQKKGHRQRIGDGERININDQNNGQNNNSQKKNGNRNKPKEKSGKKGDNKPTLTEEDIQRQVKETLARLTEKRPKHHDHRQKAQVQENTENAESETKTIKLTEFVTANELATMMGISVNQVIGKCFELGMMVSINQRMDAETINIVAEEFGYKTEFASTEVVEAIQEEEDKEEDLEPRPPIVTVMGHVDHGKTSLLDYIRNSHVIAGEAGGITQHIGAYNVTLQSGRQITFLDTPGHEAFTAMRARGAKVTDVAIIIVAADDSVMPQTREAISHAKAANVPIVFAINKVDKPNANPDKIKEELAAMDMLVEEWGGKYQSEDISAKTGMNVKELLEKVLLEADMLDLKANPNRKAQGSVIESSLDKGRGYVSTVLVSNGTLKIGDILLAGQYYGKVKAMFNERNQRIDHAGPSEPALVLGLNGAPQAGDNINVLDTDREAREIANKREQLQREQGLRTTKVITLEEIGRRIAMGNFKELKIIVKGDVDGSVEALSDSLIKLSTDEIQVNVITKAVGAISEGDVMLAAASNAIIIGFQVRPAQSARRIAESEGVQIKTYSIIYDAIDDVKAAMEGMLTPDVREEVTGTAEVRQVFKISKVGTIAGCFVTDGKIYRTSKVRVIRDGIVIHTGDLGSLKLYKDDAKEIASGQECGLNIDNYNDIAEGDVIEAYEIKEVKRTLG